MKIAILSMQRVVNFGSVLQAYSLQEMIRELTGCTAEFLDINEQSSLSINKSINDSIDYQEPADYPPGICERCKRKIITLLSAYNKKLIRKFMRDELKLDIKSINNNYDLVVVGSDEVFNHRNGVNLQLHGNIEQADKIITYAASCGNAKAGDIYPADVEKVMNAMCRFSSISVRDSATIQYLSSFYNGEIEHHLDPVLVGELYKKAHKPVKIKNYLLIYAYGQRIRTKEEINAIKAFAKAKGLKTVAMGGSQFWCDMYIPTSPFRLLDYFFYADYVVTDTFHGCIFSIINKKRFAAISRKTNSAKIIGLLQDLELAQQLIKSPDELETTIQQDIDYDAVEQILQKERLRARNYLKFGLGI